MSKSINLDTITAEEYVQYVSEKEKESFHCRVERKQFDATTGERLSHPELVKYDKNEFNMVKHNLLNMGYEVVVLYDPIKNAAKSETAEKVEVKRGRPSSK